VIRLTSPEALREAFRGAGVPLELAGESSAGLTTSDLSVAVDLILKYSVRTGHPLFYNQLYGRADPIAVIAEWLLAATNTSAVTYEVAPVFTLIEAEAIKMIGSLVGGAFKDSHDGLFVPGGSLSNMYAMHLARHKADPELTTRGAVGGPRCVAFVSDQSHYSFLKSSRVTNLGSDNLISVPSDKNGAMIPEELEKAILKAKAEGGKPFFVGSTCGSTVLGAYDPFEEIAAICRRHGLWHHVDGSWGAGVMVSSKYRHLMRGAEQADSLVWNPHKMCGVTLQCSVFLTRHVGLLSQVNHSGATYLFQPDKLYRSVDLGDKTIQCGRKSDALKFWLVFKATGEEGMRRSVDHCFHLRDKMVDLMKADASGAWVLAYEPICTNVCFWYVPRKLRPFVWETSTAAQRAELHAVAPRIKAEMQRRGDALIGFQAVNERPNFFRMIFAAADIVREDDIAAMMGRIAEIGEQETNNGEQ